MALQVLCMKIGLDTVRAWKLSIRIFCWDHGVLAGTRSSGSDGRAARGTWEDASTSLRSNNMCRNLILWWPMSKWSHTILHLRMHVMLGVHWRRRVHWAQWDQPSVGWSWSWRNCLRMWMRHRARGLWHHSIRTIWLQRLLVGWVWLHVICPLRRLPTHLLEATVASRTRCVWLGRRRGMWRAQRLLVIHRLHRVDCSVLCLEWRKGMRRHGRALLDRKSTRLNSSHWE